MGMGGAPFSKLFKKSTRADPHSSTEVIFFPGRERKMTDSAVFDLSMDHDEFAQLERAYVAEQRKLKMHELVLQVKLRAIQQRIKRSRARFDLVKMAHCGTVTAQFLTTESEPAPFESECAKILSRFRENFDLRQTVHEVTKNQSVS
jgi:hypothetical protein